MSDSDSDETPSAVSFKQSRSEFENFDNVVKDFLKERRTAIKVKRRTKDETLKKQSLVKKQKRTEPDNSVDPEVNESSSSDGDSNARFLPASVLAALTDETPPVLDTEPDTVEEAVGNRQKSTGIVISSTRKEYKKLNIQVEALNQLNQQRVDSALSFRNKRLTKFHRESVAVNAVHQQKLSASGQDLPKGKIYL